MKLKVLFLSLFAILTVSAMYGLDRFNQEAPKTPHTASAAVTTYPDCDQTLDAAIAAANSMPFVHSDAPKVECPGLPNLHWEACKAAAATDRDAAISDAINDAKMDREAAIEDAEASREIAKLAYDACSLPGTACEDLFCGMISSAAGSLGGEMDGIDSQFDADVAKANQEYTDAVKECCEEM